MSSPGAVRSRLQPPQMSGPGPATRASPRGIRDHNQGQPYGEQNKEALEHRHQEATGKGDGQPDDNGDEPKCPGTSGSQEGGPRAPRRTTASGRGQRGPRKKFITIWLIDPPVLRPNERRFRQPLPASFGSRRRVLAPF